MAEQPAFTKRLTFLYFSEVHLKLYGFLWATDIDTALSPGANQLEACLVVNRWNSRRFIVYEWKGEGSADSRSSQTILRWFVASA